MNLSKEVNEILFPKVIREPITYTATIRKQKNAILLNHIKNLYQGAKYLFFYYIYCSPLN